MATVLQRDIIDALRRLREARTAGTAQDITLCEARLNRLLEHVTDNKIGLSKREKSD